MTTKEFPNGNNCISITKLPVITDLNGARCPYLLYIYIYKPTYIRYLQYVLPRRSEENISSLHSTFHYAHTYRCVLKKKEKKGNDQKEKEKERLREKLDTEQVVGTITLSMHGITDRNEILGRVCTYMNRSGCTSQSLLNNFSNQFFIERNFEEF